MVGVKRWWGGLEGGRDLGWRWESRGGGDLGMLGPIGDGSRGGEVKVGVIGSMGGGGQKSGGDRVGDHRWWWSRGDTDLAHKDLFM